MSIADLRRDYRARALSEADAPADPLAFYRQWLDEAVRAELLDATAMTLATASPAGEPAARIVLVKDVTATGLVLDLSGTEYMSSAGLRVLMLANNAAKGRGARIAVGGLRAVLAEIFAISRFNMVFPCHATVAEATASLGG